MGDYQGKGVRRPQKAGTETEAEGMTEAQSCGNVAESVQKSVKKIGLESLLDYSEGGGKVVSKGVSNVPKVKR